MFTNITQIKKANAESGYHFFARNTMRFFASKVESKVYAGCLFLTSEKAGFNAEAREFRVRRASSDGSIQTLGSVYFTKEGAMAELRRWIPTVGFKPV